MGGVRRREVGNGGRRKCKGFSRGREEREEKEGNMEDSCEGGEGDEKKSSFVKFEFVWCDLVFLTVTC